MSEDQPAPHHAYALLRSGVPLSLLCDLAFPMNAREILEAEPADTAWLTSHVA